MYNHGSKIFSKTYLSPQKLTFKINISDLVYCTAM